MMVMTVMFMITLITLRDGAEKQKRHIYVRSSGFSFRQLKLCYAYILMIKGTIKSLENFFGCAEDFQMREHFQLQQHMESLTQSDFVFSYLTS